MAKIDFQSVDEYIASQPAETQAVLRRVRGIILKALPRATESISYQIPTYAVDGALVIYFAGWKRHWSLYPISEQHLAEAGEEASAYEVSKGTVRFPLAESVPARLVQRLVKLRARDASARAKKKVAKPRPAKK